MLKNRYALLGGLLALVLLAQACNQLGATQIKRAPHTVEEALLIAAKSGDGMTITFMQLRVNRTITSAQYDVALKQLQEVHDITQRGIDLYKAAAALCLGNGTPMTLCNVGDAADALTRAETILQILAGVLAAVDTTKPAIYHIEHDAREIKL